jgi:hypothetical protein
MDLDLTTSFKIYEFIVNSKQFLIEMYFRIVRAKTVNFPALWILIDKLYGSKSRSRSQYFIS